MAADVRERLETFLPQAIAWESDHVMTLQEVQAVMGKRKGFEDALATRGYELDLVAEYAKYETSVLELVALRMQKMRKENKDKRFSRDCTRPSQKGLTSLLRRTLARHRANPSVYKLAADTLLRVGEQEEAAAVLEEGTVALPRNEELWHLLAAASSLCPSRSQSAVLVRCLALCPGDAEALRLLALNEFKNAAEVAGTGEDAVEKACRACEPLLEAMRVFVANNHAKRLSVVEEVRDVIEALLDTSSLSTEAKAQLGPQVKQALTVVSQDD